MTEELEERYVSAQFSISMPSRHPANQTGDDAYNRGKHYYRKDYVKPKSWTLQLTLEPRSSWSLYREVDDGVYEANAHSLRWQVTQIGGAFSKIIVKELSLRGGPQSEAAPTEIQVPTPGEYEIRLQINLRSGKSVSSTRKYRFRDFLVVSIGDSFASGQGNPDHPAALTPGDKLACEAATLTKFLRDVTTKIKDKLNKWSDDASDLSQEIVGALPFVGEMAADGIELTESAARAYLSMASKLTKISISIVKGVIGGFVEGAEAVAGIFGWGDGGEFDEAVSRKARWISKYAYRSYRSGPSLAAREAEHESFDYAERITFLSFARSGSEVEKGLLGPRALSGINSDTWIGNIGQIEEVRKATSGRSIDALVISIGGNDAGFAGALTDLVMNDNFILGGKDAAERRKIEKNAVHRIKTELPAYFDSLKQAIDTQLRPRKVFITEYPSGLFTKFDDNGQVIDDRPGGIYDSWFDLDLTKEDGKAVRRLGEQLNQLIRAKAEYFGWIYVSGIDQGFAGHGYSAQRPYIVGAEESCRTQGDFEGMMHPNKDGHNIYRDCIARALRKHMIAPDTEWLEPMLFMMMS